VLQAAERSSPIGRATIRRLPGWSGSSQLSAAPIASLANVLALEIGLAVRTVLDAERCSDPVRIIRGPWLTPY